jgi:class 3 adenylate cyclase
VAIQRTIDDEFPFEVRIGLHASDATSKDRDYEGRGVHAAARIGALARGGEILASKDSLDPGLRFSTSEPRFEALKGFDEPVEVVAIDWRLS